MKAGAPSPSSVCAAPAHLPVVRGPILRIRVLAAVGKTPHFTSPPAVMVLQSGLEGRVVGQAGAGVGGSPMLTCGAPL